MPPLTEHLHGRRDGEWKPACKMKRVRFGGVDIGNDYSPDEIEWMNALDQFKRDKQCPFPTCCEMLSVLVGLGYRKIATGETS